MDTFQTIIIGGGQAGLAMGYALKDQGVSILIIDENDAIGAAWKMRYESLTLFTPKKYSQLFDFPLKGNPNAYPSKDEIVDYLNDFQRNYELPVLLQQKVIHVNKEKDGLYSVHTLTSSYKATHLVVATGAFQRPFTPEIHDHSVEQMLHASTYKNPKQIQGNKVLIVGAGNSGVQIASELSKTHQVILSASKPIKRLPQRISGKSLFWWMDVLKINNVSPKSSLGKLLMRNEPLIGDDYKTVKETVTIKGRLTEFRNGKAYYQSGEVDEVDVVIWATGYRNDYSWLNVEGVLDQEGHAIHEKGVTPEKGIYFIGLSWQTHRGSALLKGVSFDATSLANIIKQELEGK
ncbi:NAD(P)/FAD-dependent oxidoreductase [Geomicrobium sp. JCM 19039]|uniref:flavin-containing monooxygenase n=1 Tax=Geomicrobium sp. JCM 19039 TaxID=1460636 RepID=UPI00045F15A2|nr:NAD(P)/FAD-dependent oxidoreductase [Geomicrobium sp. JCM 19039]GAK12455.1 monooxygenase [Geomicrobium sp. JCM 19039]